MLLYVAKASKKRPSDFGRSWRFLGLYPSAMLSGKQRHWAIELLRISLSGRYGLFYWNNGCYYHNIHSGALSIPNIIFSEWENYI